jgi:hypothetical protein
MCLYTYIPPPAGPHTAPGDRGTCRLGPTDLDPLTLTPLTLTPDPLTLTPDPLTLTPDHLTLTFDRSRGCHMGITYLSRVYHVIIMFHLPGSYAVTAT